MSAEPQTGAKRQRRYRERLMERLDTAETAVDVLDAVVSWWTEARQHFVTRSDAANRDTMAAFVDEQMKSDITWDALVAICKPEAERRGVDCLNTRAKLRAHARYRRDHGRRIEMDDERVLMARSPGLGGGRGKAVPMGEEAIGLRLVEYGQALFDAPRGPVQFTKIAKADRMLNDLDRYPHAFVIACVMDSQVKSERAWLIPYVFAEKLGGFSIETLIPVADGDQGFDGKACATPPLRRQDDQPLLVGGATDRERLCGRCLGYLGRVSADCGSRVPLPG